MSWLKSYTYLKNSQLTLYNIHTLLAFTAYIRMSFKNYLMLVDSALVQQVTKIR